MVTSLYYSNLETKNKNKDKDNNNIKLPELPII